MNPIGTYDRPVPGHPGELQYWRRAREAADGLLSEAERAELDVHLTACAGCRDVFDRFVLARRQEEGDAEPVELSSVEIDALARDLGLDAEEPTPSLPSQRVPRARLLKGAAVSAAALAIAVFVALPQPQDDDGFTARGRLVSRPVEEISLRAFCVAGEPLRVSASLGLEDPARCPASGGVTVAAVRYAPKWAGSEMHLFLLDATGTPVPGAKSPGAPLRGQDAVLDTALDLERVPPGLYTVVAAWGRPVAQVRSLGALEVVSAPGKEK